MLIWKWMREYNTFVFLYVVHCCSPHFVIIIIINQLFFFKSVWTSPNYPPPAHRFSPALPLYIIFRFPNYVHRGHQKYSISAITMEPALLYFTRLLIATFAIARFPPGGPISLSATSPRLRSINHDLGKSKLSQCFWFIFLLPPWWFPVEWPVCGGTSKDTNLFLTSGVKIIKKYLNTQEGEETAGTGGGQGDVCAKRGFHCVKAEAVGLSTTVLDQSQSNVDKAYHTIS